MGRAATLVSLVIAMIMAEPLLGKFDQAFQYIQEFTGVFTPGIVVIFLMGMFWRKASPAGAIAAALGSAVGSFVLKFTWPTLPFMDRMSVVFLLCLGLGVLVSLLRPRTQPSNTVDLSQVSFATTPSFNLHTAIIAIILIALYTTWW